MSQKKDDSQNILRSELKNWEDEHMLTINGSAVPMTLFTLMQLQSMAVICGIILKTDGVIRQVDFIYVKE